MPPVSNGPRVLAPTGRLDASAAPRLRQQVAECLGQGEARIIVNLSQAHYLSSSTLRVLLSAHKQALRAGGALAVCGLQPQVLHVFRLVGFDQVLSIYQSEAEAVRAVSAAASTDRRETP